MLDFNHSLKSHLHKQSTSSMATVIVCSFTLLEGKNCRATQFYAEVSILKEKSRTRCAVGVCKELSSSLFCLLCWLTCKISCREQLSAKKGRTNTRPGFPETSSFLIHLSFDQDQQGPEKRTSMQPSITPEDSSTRPQSTARESVGCD
ncbi:hypothetical protein Pelo_15674 [Pelomyxa schiedti]|nr:hypothetical protein Pelo_15674 [Pelomyxa schiedti]